MSILLRPDFPEWDYSAGYSTADEIRGALERLYVIRDLYISAVRGVISNLDLPAGEISAKAILGEMEGSFHDTIEARLLEQLAKAEDGWQ